MRCMFCVYGDVAVLQDYYSMINDPIDLSKIMLKFHGGYYPSLQQFTKDMRDMFDNYKAYFADTESDVRYDYTGIFSICL